ncbi:MAG: alpha/beta fold hydrolase [Rhodocyclaceae bacterium]
MHYSVKQVRFTSHGDELAANLHLPDGELRGTVVVTGPLTSVKEQASGAYARALAQRGYAVLAFDHRGFGESEGQPQQYESPRRKIEDIIAGADWLLTIYPAQPLFALGICAGAGYMAGAVARDKRMQAFACVAGFYADAAMQRQWMGDEKLNAALMRARQAREAFEAGEPAQMIPAVGEGDVAMPLAEAFAYYGTPRGAVPNYRNAFALMSREETLVFDAQQYAAQITQPTLMIHSEKALVPALARSFYARLAGPHQEHWMQSIGQIDFYDDPALIEPAAELIAVHFSSTAD